MCYVDPPHGHCLRKHAQLGGLTSEPEPKHSQPPTPSHGLAHMHRHSYLTWFGAHAQALGLLFDRLSIDAQWIDFRFDELQIVLRKPLWLELLPFLGILHAWKSCVYYWLFFDFFTKSSDSRT